MRFFIGEECLYNGKVYHVCDVDNINSSARIGIPDSGIVWERFWVPFEELKKIEENDYVSNGC